MTEMPEETVEIPVFGPAALGLHRVGTALPPKPQPKPIQVLNARGMPARIRKKNRLFFDDDIVNDSRAMRSGASPKKSPKPAVTKPSPKILKKRKLSPTKYVKPKEVEKKAVTSTTPSLTVIPADKKTGQKIGLKLRNLLKLPKAHKWVIFEWFYSFIDQPLLGGPNEFQYYLDEKFPALKIKKLRRIHWTKIRQLMGKPRRCSQAFFEEERGELERRRQKIRLLQTKKFGGNLSFTSDLPSEIPLPLPVGTKVTARLRTPQDGIFSGSVDAVDSVTSTYRITFDRYGLGTHSIPDYEIMANDFHETISVASLVNDYRPRTGLNGSTGGIHGKGRSILNKSDPLIGQDSLAFKNPVMNRETIGPYSVKLLEPIVRLKKVLAMKETKIAKLSDLNAEAEIQKPFVSEFSDEFQRKYASTVVSIERINEEIEASLSKVHTFSKELVKEPHHAALLSPTYLREKCRTMAVEAVSRNNQGNIKQDKMLNLITNLSTVMQVASQLTSESNIHVAKILEGSIEEVKHVLHPSNVEVFQKHVQIHLHHIRLSLGQNAMGTPVKSPNKKEEEQPEQEAT